MYKNIKVDGNKNIVAGGNIFINNKFSFSDFIYNVPVERQLCSRFSYDSGYTEFLGRDNEISKLTEFCLDNRKILWWAITGVGGSGKSRLAYEFSKCLVSDRIKEIKSSEWLVRNIKWPTFCISVAFDIPWELDKNVFLVIDYVHAYETAIGQWISWLQQTSGSSNKKIRVLLIERESQKKHNTSGYLINPTWFNYLYDGFAEDNLVWGLCYKGELIKLKTVSDEAAKGIITSYCTNVEHQSVSEHIIDQIIQHTKMINEGDISPLYLQCYSDAWLHTKNIDNWSRDDVYQYLYQREVKRICQILKITNQALKMDLMMLFSVATIFGELSLYDTIIYEIQETGWITSNKKDFDEAISNLANSSLIKAPIIYGIEPDLIGEYFVLQNLSRQVNRQSLISLINILFKKNGIETLRFFKRLLNDHTDYLKKIGINDMLIETTGGIELKKATFNVTNKDGYEISCDVFFTFHSSDTDSDYIVYTDNTQDEEGNMKVYASIYNPNDEPTTLQPIETDKEWLVIAEVLEALQSKRFNLDSLNERLMSITNNPISRLNTYHKSYNMND